MSDDGLNQAQRQAVLHGDSPLLVLAGAGTGKTTVVTRRIAHLIHERRARPDQLLAVTFTNKAAREMRERAARYCEIEPRALDIGTFHGICGRLLRRFGAGVGLDPHFVIYDEADQLTLIRKTLAELKLDTEVVAPQAIRHRLEQWKNEGKTPEQVTPTFVDPIARRALEVYRMYEAACLKANAVDFGDMLLHTVTLLRHDPEVREILRRRWTHVLVDEYQDTNPVQHQLLKLLVTERHSITAVGDDDQSIYRWRGADVGNILRFEREFPGAQIIRLEQNYRSTATILEAANAVITHNRSRLGKTLFTAGARGDRLQLRVFESEREEGDAIGDTILDLAAGDRVPQAFAVLYRTNAQSRPIEDALRRRRLPYAVYGGIRFYDRKEIKDALSYLKLVQNPRSDADFLRVVNQPARGIGKTSLERLSDLALTHGVSLFEAATRAATGDGDLPTRARTKLAAFVELLGNLRADVAQTPLADFLARVLEESGYLAMLHADPSPEASDRLENLNELETAVAEFVDTAPEPSLTAFIEEATLATDVDALDPSQGSVTLMTLHAAKGLEFPVVFMPGMEEGLFPHSRSLEEKAAHEEERRLWYVGITRAKTRVYLSAALMRSVFGELRRSDLSRFLAEIPEELLDLGDRAPEPPAPRRVAHPHPTSLARDITYHQDFVEDPGAEPEPEPASDDGLAVGSRVHHSTFGEGRVLASDGEGPRRKLTIDFPGVGRKVIVARFVERV
ncbi:MAG: UvrD-helicase domain-containing protein [Deltaproteobacteria bacterium]|nr:UvrD-helicase domain-containing protein [Deltaproteobacteria bacterium]